MGAGLLADCKPSKNRSLAGNPWGAVYHGRDYAVDQEVRKHSAVPLYLTLRCEPAGKREVAQSGSFPR